MVEVLALIPVALSRCWCFQARQQRNAAVDEVPSDPSVDRVAVGAGVLNARLPVLLLLLLFTIKSARWCELQGTVGYLGTLSKYCSMLG